MSRLQANLLLLVTAMIWGSTFVVQKTVMDPTTALDASGDALAPIGPLTFTGLRFLLGALVVLPLALREQKAVNAGKAEGVAKAPLLLFVLIGSVLLTGSIMQQVGLLSTSVTNAGFFTGLYVPLVPVLAFFLFKQVPHRAILMAMVGCIAGTYLLNGTLTDFASGDLWVLGGALAWALHVTLVGIYAPRTGRPLTLACTQFAGAGIIGTGLALAIEPTSWAQIAEAGPEILWAGIMSIGVAFTLQVVAQRYTKPADAALILASEMFFAAVAGALFLGERLSPSQLLGCALIMGSIIAVEILPYLRKSTKNQPKPETP